MNPGKYGLDQAYAPAAEEVFVMIDGSANGDSSGGAYPYRYAEQYTSPEPQRVSDVALTT